MMLDDEVETTEAAQHMRRRMRSGMNYRKMLDDGYRAFTCMPHDKDRSRAESRAEYLSSEIFGFTTDDGDMDRLFVSIALGVCQALSTNTTFDYIDDPERYKLYLMMMNMPFFSCRTMWGKSIRGAWWDIDSPRSDFCASGLYVGRQQVLGMLVFDRDTWVEFIQAILDFAQSMGDDPP